MKPEPTPAGTTNGWLNCLVCTCCWLVIWTTAGRTSWLTERMAVTRSVPGSTAAATWPVEADVGAGAGVLGGACAAKVVVHAKLSGSNAPINSRAAQRGSHT